MNRAQLWDHGNGAIGAFIAINDRNEVVGAGFFTRNASGDDRVFVGEAKNPTSLALTIGNGALGNMAPARRRIDAGFATIEERSESRLRIRFEDFDINAGYLQPSPPAPLFNGVFDFTPVTSL